MQCVDVAVQNISDFENKMVFTGEKELSSDMLHGIEETGLCFKLHKLMADCLRKTNTQSVEICSSFPDEQELN